MITIIGGGASGTALAANLLRWAAAPVAVSLVEGDDRRLHRGVAYSTSEGAHRLNVPAAKMSLFPSEPDHFLDWARANLGASISPTDFAQRRSYGQYLDASLRAAEASAVPGARLERVPASAIDVSAAGDVLLSSGIALRGDQVVLALGNQPPSRLGLDAYFGAAPFTADPWDGALEYLDARGPVLLVGTGLTMVDVALSYLERGHDAPIHAVSRHGLLPQAHVVGGAAAYAPGPAYADFLASARNPESAPRDVFRIVRVVRSEVREVQARGGDWRPVFDALRPVTQNLWRGLGDGQRRVFLDLFRRYWDVHRHRISPESSRILQNAIAEGRLIVHRADGASGESPPPRAAAVSRVVNCTGPSARYDRSPNPLLRRLFETGAIAGGPLGLGLNAEPDGTIVGRDGDPSPVLTTLGPPLAGILWESTAMPEIRGQAEALAKRLLKRAGVPSREVG